LEVASGKVYTAHEPLMEKERKKKGNVPREPGKKKRENSLNLPASEAGASPLGKKKGTNSLNTQEPDRRTGQPKTP